MAEQEVSDGDGEVIDAGILDRLVALDLPADKLSAVMAIVADSHKRSNNAERQARFRAKRKLESVTSNVTNNVTNNVTGVPPSPPMINNSTPHNPLPNNPSLRSGSVMPKSEDLFAEVSKPTDPRKARKAANDETLEFVGEAWNALAQQFPRMARLGVIPDGGTRETQILSRTKDLLKDFDFTDMQSGWKAFFLKVRESPFLRGDAAPSGGREVGFKPTIDKLTRREMFTKIMEDHYVQEIQFKPKTTNGFAHAYR